MFSTSLSSSIWNPTTYRPSAPAWKYPSSTRTQLDNQEYNLPTFKHPCLSSPGRRPPVSGMNFASRNYRDLSPMQVASPHHGLKMAEKSRTICSPIVIPDSPSPSVITISSSSDRSNSLDITGKGNGPIWKMATGQRKYADTSTTSFQRNSDVLKQ